MFAYCVLQVPILVACCCKRLANSAVCFLSSVTIRTNQIRWYLTFYQWSLLLRQSSLLSSFSLWYPCVWHVRERTGVSGSLHAHVQECVHMCGSVSEHVWKCERTCMAVSTCVAVGTKIDRRMTETEFSSGLSSTEGLTQTATHITHHSNTMHVCYFNPDIIFLRYSLFTSTFQPRHARAIMTARQASSAWLTISNAASHSVSIAAVFPKCKVPFVINVLLAKIHQKKSVAPLTVAHNNQYKIMAPISHVELAPLCIFQLTVRVT